MTKRHLHRYVAEFEFRYNTLTMDDGARMIEAIRQMVGKCLLHKAPIPS